jgi:hypothetical protein
LTQPKLLLRGEETLGAAATERVSSLLRLGDPGGEVGIAHRIKERLGDFYRCSGADQARQMLEEPD